ncbi:transporter [Halorubellus sp. JP-L1]|uniref:pentapeptide repeat-containing protein n=1 Tax=Halorubellus sp. JP-L1 TaxID=2715753 RepID=UPI00140E6A89|nr:pentapeptide repeat-containing protein [Halorubellus sp. JP-L1]NHN43013.1 transporter [Halorubellus sp. JP-L1]
MSSNASAPSMRHRDENPPDDVCGYVHDLTTVEDVGGACCYRPTLEGGDHCIWHSEDETRPSVSFDDNLPDPGERLDGAHVPAVKLVDTDAFEGCSLIGATFDATILRGSSFQKADLREAEFQRVDARGVDFSDANLSGASVHGTDFRDASFARSRFDQAIISNTRVNRSTTFGGTTEYERELEHAESKEAYRKDAEAAVWTYREIHGLFIENALPLEAREYYNKEKDTRRRLAWHMGHYPQAIKAEASKWVTGYGMNPYRVIGTAAVVIVVCAFLFPLTGGIEETTGDDTARWSLGNLSGSPAYIGHVIVKSLYFSTITFTTLGYGDITPVGTTARVIAGVESLLGALLTALLVFVLSRRIS